MYLRKELPTNDCRRLFILNIFVVYVHVRGVCGVCVPTLVCSTSLPLRADTYTHQQTNTHIHTSQHAVRCRYLKKRANQSDWTKRTKKNIHTQLPKSCLRKNLQRPRIWPVMRLKRNRKRNIKKNRNKNCDKDRDRNRKCRPWVGLSTLR